MKKIRLMMSQDAHKNLSFHTRIKTTAVTRHSNDPECNKDQCFTFAVLSDKSQSEKRFENKK